MLSGDEREYLFRLAGQSPPPASDLSSQVSAGIRNLLDSMPEAPAYVVDAKYDILAWNRLATFFIGDLSEIPVQGRNMIRWTFRQPAADVPWTDEATLRFVRATVADLRGSYARNPSDNGIAELVTELLALSPVFAEMWAEHVVESRRPLIKRIDHPLAGADGVRVPDPARGRHWTAPDHLLRGAGLGYPGCVPAAG